jgi:hypothetical protein
MKERTLAIAKTGLIIFLGSVLALRSGFRLTLGKFKGIYQTRN